MMTFFGAAALTALPVEPVNNDVEVISLQDGSKQEIAQEDLPMAVQEALKNDQFSNWTVNKVYEVTKSDNSVYYSIEFDDGGGQTTTVKFDKNGEVIG